MKVLLAIQATGNGHLSRARAIIPELRKHCKLDIAVSGNRAQVTLPEAPQHSFKGLSISIGRRGGLDYRDTVKNLSVMDFFRDVIEFPCEDYDLIVNDFEPVTAWSARLKSVPSIAFGHQPAFLSPKTPRAEPRDSLCEFLFRNYAPCDDRVGFHFQSYDDFIYTPIIRPEVRNLDVSDQGHVTVYLAAYEDAYLIDLLRSIKDAKWHIFSRTAEAPFEDGQFRVMPIENGVYLKSLASCSGLLTGGGFEGPAEALYLGKKLIAVPMRGQYEQQCNGAALRTMGVTVLPRIDQESLTTIDRWVREGKSVPVNYPDNLREIIGKAISRFADDWRQSKSHC